MAYFRQFPLMAYDVKGNKDYKLVTNILRRVKLRASLKNGLMLFDKYDVVAGENPEDIAFKYYGSSELHWVILMTNNITDRFYQWPMTQPQFDNFLTDKYGAGSEDAIHHYEIDQLSGPTSSNGPDDYSHRVQVNSDHDNPYIITNREYEERIQDKNRQIQLLSVKHLPIFVEEFEKLISR
tara:strand:- start:746 stop:1288 length:543 start_codon:yes stop_codon:yes gene_type:complete